MARLASQSKGGFYPIPLDELTLLFKRINFHCDKEENSHRLINLLDPCCGKGHALNTLSKHLKIQGADPITYGVELESSRAEEAGSVLNHVIQDGYENLRTEAKYSVLWLNPPYDDGFAERVEVSFLRALTSKEKGVLAQDGLLLFCVPQSTLKGAASVLSSRFYDLKVYRFTDANYDTFGQVIVLGYRGIPKTEERRANLKYLKDLAVLGPDALPSLDQIDDVVYTLTPSPSDIKVFRAGRLRPEELVMDLGDSPLFQEIEEKCSPKIENVVFKNPMLPLKEMHYGIAIAANAVGGNMGSHIISGMTKRKTETHKRYNDDGKEIGEEIIEFFKTSIRVFTPTGIYDLE